VSVGELECSPLAALLMGASKQAAPAAAGAEQTRWVAVVDYQHLSLRCLHPRCKLLVESSLSGHRDADFVLVYTVDPYAPASLLPEGDFHLEKTPGGNMAWKYGVPGEQIEESLAFLGRRMFGPDGAAGESRPPA
jgi:hypothetical protein